MKAIILSAGQGRRLMPLTESVPKCCLHLDGISMLEWQISALSECGVDEIVVVTGFGHSSVEKIVKRIRHIAVRTLYNPFYALSDNLGTCWVARSEMREPFLLINGDTLFEPKILKRLMNAPEDYPITLATDSKSVYDDDDMKVAADLDKGAESGRLLQVGKKLDSSIVNGESIGMMLFTGSGADTFVGKVESLMETTDGLKRWYLSAIDELAHSGSVGFASVQGLSWCEIDDLTDFAYAESVVRGWKDSVWSPAVDTVNRDHQHLV
jgi:choline kinase